VPGLLRDASWAEINALRDRVMALEASSVERVAQSFAEELVRTFSSIVLARVFVVMPLDRLPRDERAFVAHAAGGDPALLPQTPVLSLLGTAGHDPAWCDRRLSQGHRGIPLLSGVVRNAPMLVKLLADLGYDVASPGDGGSIVSRRMLGGANRAFFVADAQTALDTAGRPVISARDFVAGRGIRTVFGMGGPDPDGMLAVAIAFTTELLDRLVVDRFPSLIGNFKIKTMPLILEGRIYEPDPDARAPR
jgi:hypothetical protein